VSSPTREIKPAACEMQFRDSVGALAGFGGAPVAITEESFKGWSQVNAEDNVGYTMETLTPETRADNLPLGNGGSGDQLDLASLMNDMYYARGPLMTYTRFCIRPAPLVSTDVTDETIFALKSVVKNPPNNLSKKDVVEFTVRFVDYDNIGHLEVLHSHALIALRIFEANVGQQKLTIIRVLDSNGPQIGEITCADDKPPVVYQGQKYKSCYYPPLGYIILTTPTHFNTYLAEQHDTWCRDHAASLNSFETEYCNRDFGEWLQDSDNYMAINNGTGQLSSQNGYCASWSMFTILVAYKGIFTGYDYHPNDGYIVGHGCNAQHYPDESGKKSAKLNPTNWLGSIYNSSSNWLGSISDALSKFWPFK
ncbi:MAG: hypothetical protein NT094_02760, partial [Candidatus Staskawiczbacteria bacterium]|nr:hypothetical protein [Candidatus Staskawiczbacteria bacterium]